MMYVSNELVIGFFSGFFLGSGAIIYGNWLAIKKDKKYERMK